MISNMNETVQHCITFIGVMVISNMNETVQHYITFIGVLHLLEGDKQHE